MTSLAGRVRTAVGTRATGVQRLVHAIFTSSTARTAAPACYTSTVPGASPILDRLQSLHDRHRDDRSGQVADYIPELARVDPDAFGIAVAVVDGQVYEVGDSRHEFTIQSVSKAFIFGLALQDHGREALLSRVGVEPTGDPFNSIVLDEVGNRPPNPMVNAGAIAVTGLVRGTDAEERWERIVGNLSAFAGRRLDVDEAVARSESETGHRNRAIAYLMRGFDMIRPEVDEVLDLYFRQCAVKVNAVDLALMGATLAAGGRQPLTGQQVIGPDETGSVLSVMTSCGMYDSSGEWIYRVGLPAKSGVGGGIVAVLPGQAAIGVFSPRLDTKGNSVRGLRVCEELSRELGLHLFSGRRSIVTLRSTYGRDTVTSRYRRLAEEEQALRRHGAELQIVELQGTLGFGAVEVLTRHVLQILDATRELVLDFRRVPDCTTEGLQLLADLVERCLDEGVDVVFAAAPRDDLAGLRSMTARRRTDTELRIAHSLDSALEAAEDRLLHRYGFRREVDGVDLADAEACAGLDDDDLACLRKITRERCYGRGETIARPGDPASSAWIILGGVLTVSSVGGPGGPGRRLRSVGPGSILGEMSLLSGGRRSAWVQAETPVRVLELGPDGLAEFTEQRPLGAARLLRNICTILSRWLRDANPDPHTTAQAALHPVDDVASPDATGHG